MDPLDVFFSSPEADPYGCEARLLRRTLDRLVAADQMPPEEADAILRWCGENRGRWRKKHSTIIDAASASEYWLRLSAASLAFPNTIGRITFGKVRGPLTPSCTPQ